MSVEIPAEALQLRSLVRADQTLELFLDMVPVPAPGPDEVLIRVEAAPLNPSDMGLLFGGADMAAAIASGPAGRPVVTAPILDAAMRGLAGRVGTRAQKRLAEDIVDGVLGVTEVHNRLRVQATGSQPPTPNAAGGDEEGLGEGSSSSPETR